jgi:hypothetical protein
MDEILELLLRFMSQVSGSIDELDDQEAGQIAQFLNEALASIQQLNETGPAPQKPQLPPGVELLWILSGNDPNAFVNYLRTYPGPGLKELAANPTQLANVIEQLQRFNPQREITEGADGIQNTMYPSSNVAGLKYNPNTHKLLVKFHGVEKEPIYQYEGVPRQIFEFLRHGNAIAQTKGKNRWGEWWKGKSPSIGRGVVDYLIKSGYNYRRLN